MLRVCSTKKLKFRATILSQDYLSTVLDISVKKSILLVFFCVPIQFYNYLASEFPLGAPLVPKSS